MTVFCDRIQKKYEVKPKAYDTTAAHRVMNFTALHTLCLSERLQAAREGLCHTPVPQFHSSGNWLKPPRGKVPCSLRPVWIHTPSSKLLAMAKLFSELPSLPSQHTQRGMGAGISALSTRSKSWGHLSRQKGVQVETCGSHSGFWYLIPPEVFFTLQIWPYSF